MPAVEVTLSPDELLQATTTGVMRYTQNMRLGRRDAYGAEKNAEHGMWTSIVGAWGEAAVAKHTNTYHWGLGVFRGPDVGRYQVRATRMARGFLILHDRDKEQHGQTPYVSLKLLGTDSDGCERIAIQGWCYPDEMCHLKFWDDPTGKNRPAYFVPPEELRDMETLPECHSNLQSHGQ